MEIKEIEVDEFSNIETMNICYNCTHASSGSKTVICMGGTPWKGEELKFNSYCKSFTAWYHSE
jgi:hypothetical protein